MFKELARTLGAITVEPAPFDASTLDDDVALRTDWTPLKGGGASFRTHRLVLERPNRITFRVTWGNVAFCMAFVVVGVIAIAVGLLVTDMPGWVRILVILIGTAAAGGVGGHLLTQSSPNVFDVNRRYYETGRLRKQQVHLDEIHALQLISERCRGRDSSFYSYELNLVLEDGRRVNVVDHGNVTQLRADARTVAQRLEVPVWDAT